MTVKSNTRGEKPLTGRRGRAAVRDARQKRQQRLRIIYILIGILAVVGLGALIAPAILNPDPSEAINSLGNSHVDESQIGTTSYNSTPPTSGPHLNAIARWGIHDSPIPNELQVHNLEDGGVMVQYNCPDGCGELVAQLTQLVNHYDDHLILAPYPDMDARIALTAWGRIDKLSDFDEERIERFIETYSAIDHHRG
jgi:hypothetical protein